MQIEKMRAFIIRVLFYCIILGLAYAVLKSALPFLMPFLVAFLIAFILKPVINWVTQKDVHKRQLYHMPKLPASHRAPNPGPAIY